MELEQRVMRCSSGAVESVSQRLAWLNMLQTAGRAIEAEAPMPHAEADDWHSRPRPIKNQQLMFEQKRLGDNGTSTATSKESGDRGDEMDEQDGQVARLATN